MDLPPLVRSQFTEKNGTVGRLVLVEPVSTEKVLNRRSLSGFVQQLRSVADRIAPGTPVVGSFQFVQIFWRQFPRRSAGDRFCIPRSDSCGGGSLPKWAHYFMGANLVYV